MAGVHCLDMRVHVGDGQATFGKTAIEIVLVTFERLAFIKFLQLFGTELTLIDVFFNRLACNFASVHEEPTFAAFEQNAVVASTCNVHFHATGKLCNDVEVVGGVEAVILFRVSIPEWDGMFHVGAVHFDRSGAFLVESCGPEGNVDNGSVAFDE